MGVGRYVWGGEVYLELVNSHTSSVYLQLLRLSASDEDKFRNIHVHIFHTTFGMVMFVYRRCKKGPY